jgi:hypothetical protein
LAKKIQTKIWKKNYTAESRILPGNQAKTGSYGLNHRIGHRCVGVMVCSKSFLFYCVVGPIVKQCYILQINWAFWNADSFFFEPEWISIENNHSIWHILSRRAIDKLFSYICILVPRHFLFEETFVNLCCNCWCCCASFMQRTKYAILSSTIYLFF